MCRGTYCVQRSHGGAEELTSALTSVSSAHLVRPSTRTKGGFSEQTPRDCCWHGPRWVGVEVAAEDTVGRIPDLPFQVLLHPGTGILASLPLAASGGSP